VSDNQEELDHAELIVSFWGLEDSLDRIQDLLRQIADLVKEDEN